MSVSLLLVYQKHYYGHLNDDICLQWLKYEAIFNRSFVAAINNDLRESLLKHLPT